MEQAQFNLLFERNLLRQLQRGSIRAFIYFYSHYREELELVAFRILKDQQKAEEAVDDLFESLWGSPGLWELEPPLEPCLFGRIRAFCRGDLQD